ncbi:unnamed protein product [Calypogeia fissa]
MVWFQCEDCGENLKKPKLLMHFNRCSAYKLSCIDCGVVFDQQSVQAHSSCVSEAEKYGPKGLSKGATGPAPKPKNCKVQNGSDVDFSRGLSTCPPWSCSLCNVKATSQETLELHAQGKKHQSRSKAAAAKEKKEKQGGETAELNNGSPNDDLKGVEMKETAEEVALDSPNLSAEKKRKKERTTEGDDLTALPSGNLEKKPKRETSAVVATSSINEGDSELPNSVKDSHDKKRKLVEEHQEIILEETGQVAGKKSRKKGKVVPGEGNGHREGAPEVSGSSPVVAKDENCEQVKKKEKKGCPSGNGSLPDNKTQTLPEVNTSKSSDVPEKVQQEDSCKVSKKEKKKKDELKGTIVHEISFREWLGDDDGTQAGTPTHPPHDMNGGKEDLEQLEGAKKVKQAGMSKTDATQDGIAKVVKWKKIIREVLGKLVQSLNGKLKKKDLKKAVLPLAEKAIESASISVDRKALKAELMRQVNSSPKFLVDGKHVMLARKD